MMTAIGRPRFLNGHPALDGQRAGVKASGAIGRAESVTAMLASARDQLEAVRSGS